MLGILKINYLKIMFISLIESVLSLFILTLLALWLRRKDILKEDYAKGFSGIITNLILPALIFANMSREKLNLSHIWPAIIMLIAVIMGLTISYFVGRMLKLEKKALGAFIIVSGFGSSSSLGYALISHIFPANVAAMLDSITIGELGCCIPFFLIGIPIVMYYGDVYGENDSKLKDILIFFRSPIFISLILGITVSFIPTPECFIKNLIYQILDIIGSSLMLFVSFTIGLMLKPIHLRRVVILLLWVVLIKMMIEPLFCLAAAKASGVDIMDTNVLFIEAAMPSGSIATVMAARYGCDGTLAATIVIATYLISLISLPLMAYLFM
jgi:hypothetical protein